MGRKKLGVVTVEQDVKIREESSAAVIDSKLLISEQLVIVH